MTSGTAYSPPPAFGRFRLLHQIGVGVLGQVFRTHDPDGDRLAAVKAFTLDLTPEQAALFAEELRGLTTVDMPHTHLAAPLDAGVEESVAYLAMQHVAGESLDSAIRQYGPAPAQDAVRLISHVAEALDAGARVGVFHGTLHPRDILVTPGETHLTGLGIATALEHVGMRAPIRRPYAAPEREAGRPWGSAADVFALAAIAHEVLTGQLALPGSEEPLPGLDEVTAHDAVGLREVLEAALDPDPERRPATATDVANGIAVALGLAGGATAGSAGRPAGPRRRMRAKLSSKLPSLDEPLAAAQLEPPGPEPELPAPVLAPAPEDLRSLPDTVQPVALPVADTETVEGEAALPEPSLLLAEDVGSVDVTADDVATLVSAETSVPPPPVVESQLPSTAPAAAVLDLSDVTLPFVAEPSDIAVPLTGPDAQAYADELTELDATKLSVPDRRRDERFITDDVRAQGVLVTDPPAPTVRDSATPSRATLPTRNAEPCRPGPAQPRGLMVPVAISVGAGLLAGLIIGYWLGNRSVVFSGAAPPSTAASQPPASGGSAPAPRTPQVPTAAQPAPHTRVEGQATTVPEPVGLPSAPTSAVQPRAAPELSVPPIPGGDGRIRVRSTPASADVFLEGERQGVTPRDLPNLPFGRHTIRVTRPGYVPQQRVVTVGRDRRDPRVMFTLTRRASPRTKAPGAAGVRPQRESSGLNERPRTAQVAAVPGSAPAVTTGALSIDTLPPGALVRLDGRDVGVSPLLVRRVKPGRHTVRLELPGFTPWTTTVTVKAGDTLRVAASLERAASR